MSGASEPAEVARAAALLDLLAARRGLICAVGAGGKKSTLYQLLRAHRRLGAGRALLTATVQTAPPPRDLAEAVVVAAPDVLGPALAAALERHRTLVAAAPATKPGRLAGLPPAVVAALAADPRIAATLVKADGARMRLIKAPAPDEPVLPAGVTTLLPVVSARALGEPLVEAAAHRPERLAALLGLAPGALLQPAHLAALLTSPEGALQHAGAATVVPIINMVETAAQRAGAEAAARLALARTERFERVVLARMAADEPVVAVITR
jgi:probable selenium-dependent hydroxylase accessory protein YqeC